MRFDIITIFPKIFNSYFSESILKRARTKKLVIIRSHDIRKFSRDKHKKVDDKPYGGGAGMVIQAEPVLRAVSALKIKNYPVKIVLLSAKGKQFTQKMAHDWAKKYDQLILISGRYEGIDERVKIALNGIIKKGLFNSDRAYRDPLHASIKISFEEISIGPYVLTDGDAAAMVIISAVARLIPGVIKLESLKEESHRSGLEYPHYTRPEAFVWKGKTYRAPKILLSGDHKKIEKWRRNRMK